MQERSHRIPVHSTHFDLSAPGEEPTHKLNQSCVLEMAGKKQTGKRN